MIETRKLSQKIAARAYCHPREAARMLPDLWAARRAESWSYASRADRARWGSSKRRRRTRRRP